MAEEFQYMVTAGAIGRQDFTMKIVDPDSSDLFDSFLNMHYTHSPTAAPVLFIIHDSEPAIL